MNEPPLAENELQLTSEYRVSSDKYNLILQKRYQKRSGKGRNAELIDEWDYNDVGYYGNLKSLIRALVDKEVLQSASQVSKLEDTYLKIEALKREMQVYISDKVILKWYNPKLKDVESGDVVEG